MHELLDLGVVTFLQILSYEKVTMFVVTFGTTIETFLDIFKCHTTMAFLSIEAKVENM